MISAVIAGCGLATPYLIGVREVFYALGEGCEVKGLKSN